MKKIESSSVRFLLMDDQQETRRQRIKAALLSTHSAAVAGLVFAVCATVGLLRLIEPPGLPAAESDILAYWSNADAGSGISWTLQLVFFAAAGFLWFVGVIRSRLTHEPKLFATVFFGGGVALVVLLLVGSAAFAIPAVMAEFSPVTPSVDIAVASRALAVILIVDIGTRVQALFIFSTSGLGRQTGALPKWLVLSSYVVGLGLLLNTGFRLPVVSVAFPVWVAIVSLVLLIRRPTMSATATEDT